VKKQNIIRLLGMAVVLMPVAGAEAANERFTILGAEPVQAFAIERTSGRDAAGAAAAARRVHFVAYGRAFELHLEPNDRLLSPGLRDDLDLEIYRGTMKGDRATWVRLSLAGGALAGLLWDGSELYGLRQSFAEPADDEGAAGRGLTIYRVRDVIGDLHDEAIPSAASLHDTLAAELEAVPSFQRVNLGVVLDTEMIQEREGTTSDVIGAINLADGIFASQLGIQLHVGAVAEFANEPDPFSATDIGGRLQELRAYRASDPTMSAQGEVMLFSGHLFSEALGAAYISGLCTATDAVAITAADNPRDASVVSLIVAHELGHAFGAPHDGEPGPCQGTPAGFLMAPTLNESTEFSACSLDQMRAVIAQASCLLPVLDGNVALSLAGPSTGYVGQQLAHTVQVTNTGSESVYATSVDIDVGPGLEILGADLLCARSDALVHCMHDVLPPDETHEWSLLSVALQEGTSTIVATARPANDSTPGDNSSELPVLISPSVDVSVRTSTPEVVGHPDSIAHFELILENHGGRAADGVVLHVTADEGGEVSGVSVGQTPCVAVSGNHHQCTVDTLGAGTSVTAAVTVHLPALPPEDGVLFLASVDTVEPNISVVGDARVRYLVVEAFADLRIIPVAIPAQITSGTVETLAFGMENAGPDDSSGAVLEFDVSGPFAIDDVRTSIGSCDVPQDFPLSAPASCSSDTLPPGETMIVELDVVAPPADQQTFHAELIATAIVSTVDPDTSNNASSYEILITSPPPAGGGGSGGGIAAGGGGGGGATWLPLIAALARFSRRVGSRPTRKKAHARRRPQPSQARTGGRPGDSASRGAGG
jgi:hypothetical protein